MKKQRSHNRTKPMGNETIINQPNPTESTSSIDGVISIYYLYIDSVMPNYNFIIVLPLIPTCLKNIYLTYSKTFYPF